MSFILTNHKVLNYPEYDYTMPAVPSDPFPGGDCSFRATLRVLLPRNDYCGSLFRLRYRERRIATQEYEQSGPDGVAALLFSELQNRERVHLTIINVTGRKARPVVRAANNIRSALPNHKRLEDIELYLKQNRILAQLLEGDEEEYLEALDVLCERFDLRRSSVERHLNGFERGADQGLLTKKLDHQKYLLARMDECKRRLENLIRENHISR